MKLKTKLQITIITLGFLAIIAAVILDKLGAESSLFWSTLALGALIFAFLSMSQLWEYLDQIDTTTPAPAPAPAPAPGGPGQPAGTPNVEMATAFSESAKLAVTVQGVVLGLIFALKGQDLSATAKVGAGSLTTGVVSALMLYSLTVVQVTVPSHRAIAALLFNLTIWALAYGLFCVTAVLISN